MDLQAIIAVIVEWVPKISTVVAGCALIATVTPTKVDDRLLQLTLDIINKIGLNIGKAINKDS